MLTKILSGYSLKPPLDLCDEIFTNVLHDLCATSHWKLHKTNHFSASKSTKYQEICLGTQKQCLFAISHERIRFKADQQGQRDSGERFNPMGGECHPAARHFCWRHDEPLDHRIKSRRLENAFAYKTWIILLSVVKQLCVKSHNYRSCGNLMLSLFLCATLYSVPCTYRHPTR